jgi:hypothetical protein
MVKIFYHKEYYNTWCSEIAILYCDLIKSFNIDDSRFNNVTSEYFLFVDTINECDYVVLPYKWRGLDITTNKIIEDCNINNKKLLVFYNDDDSRPIHLNTDVIIFRTSIFSNDKNINEVGLPPFFDDEFKNEFIEPKNIELSVGFCGFDHYERKETLQILKMNDKIKTDFIIRKSFWAKEVDKNTAIFEFNKNIKNNLFGFCSRGAGNFSYRFYQVLSMGRIPILLNTNCVLPFESLIDYRKHCLIVDIPNVNDIDIMLIEYFNSKTKEELFYIQKTNRTLYEDFLSPNGFLKTLNFTLKNNIYAK